MAPSRHDWKIVDWDVKPQHNQPTNMFEIVKKCKISLPAQDQLSGERCRNVGPLVTNVQLEKNGKKINESENYGKSTLENLLTQKIFDVPTYNFKTIK